MIADSAPIAAGERSTAANSDARWPAPTERHVELVIEGSPRHKCNREKSVGSEAAHHAEIAARTILVFGVFGDDFGRESF